MQEKKSASAMRILSNPCCPAAYLTFPPPPSGIAAAPPEIPEGGGRGRWIGCYGFFERRQAPGLIPESRRRSGSDDTSPVIRQTGVDFGMYQRTEHPPTGRVAGQKSTAPQRHQFFGMLQAAVQAHC